MVSCFPFFGYGHVHEAGHDSDHGSDYNSDAVEENVLFNHFQIINCPINRLQIMSYR